MGFLSGKLQAYNVQTATLQKREITTYFFWNMYQKLAILKNIKKVLFLRKKSMMDQRLNKVAAL